MKLVKKLKQKTFQEKGKFSRIKPVASESPAKTKAPISLTSSDILKLTTQTYRNENKFLKPFIENSKMKLKSYQ